MLKKRLLYLLIILIPLQLARHFFADFAKVAGIFVDYFIPTFYLTDIVVLTLIILSVNDKKLSFNKATAAFIGYLILNSLFIAGNQGIALVRVIKLTEFAVLFLVLTKIKPKHSTVIKAFSIAVIYSSILAIWQFISHKSIGGWWWFLGERTFYESTPGIALANISGRLFLRPYATFPHPNVLGGFLALTIPLIFRELWNDKVRGVIKTILLPAATIVGLISLILTFSRAALLIFTLFSLLLIMINNEKFRKFLAGIRRGYFWIFILFFVLSITAPVVISENYQLKNGSLYERNELVRAALTNFLAHPIWGTGLNNSVSLQYKFLPKSFGLFVLQPVHNIYLLILTELGSAGFVFLLYFLYKFFEKINETNIERYLPFFMILLLGFYDHYLFTLQQGLMILTVFTSLVFWPEK